MSSFFHIQYWQTTRQRLHKGPAWTWRKPVRLLALVSGLFFIAAMAAAQPQHLFLHHIDAKDGLPNPVVTSITQDHLGFIWLGTYNGLSRYDGHRFKTFQRDVFDSTALQDDRITVLLEDNKNNLWIGTHRGGLYRYDFKLEKFTRFDTKAKGKRRLSHDHVASVYQDNSGQLWVGTYDGLNLYNPRDDSFSQYHLRKGEENQKYDHSFIFSITHDNSGNAIFLVNERAIYRFDYRRKTIVKDATLSDVLKGQEARHIYSDSKKRLWISTRTGGLIRYDYNTRSVFRTSDSEPWDRQTEVKGWREDHNGIFWVVTASGAIRSMGTTENEFRDMDIVSPYATRSTGYDDVFIDRAGSMWFATFNGVDINHPDRIQFEYFTHEPHNPNSLSHKSVVSVLEDSYGKIWIGTDGGGLNLFDRRSGKFQTFRHDPQNPKSLSSDVVRCIVEDSDRNLWLASVNGGLDMLDRKTSTFKKIRTGVAEFDQALRLIWRIYEDHDGNLWLSTLGNGLLLYHRRENRFEHFRPLVKDGLSDYNVFDIFQDSQNRLWVGTENQGLNLFDFTTRKFTTLRWNASDTTSLSDDHPWTIFEDAEKDVWIATGNGLNRLQPDGKSFTRYIDRESPGRNITLDIVEDRFGYLWIPTGDGITRLHRATGHVNFFNAADGLEATHYHINASTITRAGEIYVGGPEGLQIFNPVNHQDNRYVAPVIFTDVRLFDNALKVDTTGILKASVTGSKKIVLSHKESFITINFALLNFISPEKNKYRYRLLGLSDKWIQTDKPEATFTQLNPGKYVLQVLGCNSDGYWTEKSTELRIVITVPWWKSWWFKLICVALAAVTSFGLYRYRIAVIKKMATLASEQETIRHQANMAEAEFRAEKLEIELARNKLETEVQLKNAALASKVTNTARQNEVLLKLREDILLGMDTMKENDSSLTYFRKIIRTISREIQQDDSNDQFEALFNQLHENFVSKLKERYPDLTSRDLRVCACIRLNLTSKEIASLFNLSPRGMEDMRYRIRKKMNLDSSVNLADFILSLNI